VDAIDSLLRTALLAHVAWLLAILILMTNFQALVTSALEGLCASQSATKRLLIAGNSFALLVLAIAELCRKEHARRTGTFRVTNVSDWMLAILLAFAGLATFWKFGAAIDGRINHFGAAFTAQLVERHARTFVAIPDVTFPIAAMLLARQQAIAIGSANVLWIDAALVASTVSHLDAFLLAANVSRCEILARDLFLNLSAAALDARRLFAFASSQMTFVGAQMRRGEWTTVEWLGADILAQRNWIYAGSSLAWLDSCLFAGTRRNRFRCQLADFAVARMTNLCAIVIATCEFLVARLLARKVEVLKIVDCAASRFGFLAAEALLVY